MNGPSMTAPALRDLLKGGTLTGEWVLDPRNSSIRLKSKSMGVIPVKGIFREVSGSGTVSPDGMATGTLLVAAASIDTQNPRRDTHLRSADFFDSDSHPDISFTADDIRPSAQGVAVTGALTIRGRTRPLSFDARRLSRATARSGSTPRSASTAPTSASPGITGHGLANQRPHRPRRVHPGVTE